MKKGLLFVYFIFILSEIVTSCFGSKDEDSEKVNVGDPLILTPLIDNDKIEEARNKSTVNLGGIESYSGYLTVNEQFDSNLFFWFFPSQSHTNLLKLVLWIQGEPGRSSMFSLFIENGPFQIISSENFINRNLSWNKFQHILYIDSPVGTGFSFTNGGYAENAIQVAKELYIALLQFYKLFPEYNQYELYIAGQWLAGKYLPELANIIKRKNNFNRNSNYTKKIINLSGLIMGNALSDPEKQIKYGEYLYQLGLINSTERKIFKCKENIFRLSIKMGQYHQAYKLFQEMMTMFGDYTKLQKYHYHNYNYQDDKIALLDSHVEKFVTSKVVRSFIHVGNISFQRDDKVEYNIRYDIMKSVAQLVKKLSDDYTIIYYSGQFDIIINYPGTIEYIESLNYPDYFIRQREFNSYLRLYTIKIRRFFVNFVMGAGHMTTFDNPRYMFEKIKNL